MIVEDDQVLALTDDDEVELAYFFLPPQAGEQAPDRLAYLLYEDFPFPSEASAGAGAFAAPIEVGTLAPAGGGEGITYAVLLTFYDGDSIGWLPPVAIAGVRLPGLAEYLRRVVPPAAGTRAIAASWSSRSSGPGNCWRCAGWSRRGRRASSRRCTGATCTSTLGPPWRGVRRASPWPPTRRRWPGWPGSPWTRSATRSRASSTWLSTSPRCRCTPAPSSATSSGTCSTMCGPPPAGAGRLPYALRRQLEPVRLSAGRGSGSYACGPSPVLLDHEPPGSGVLARSRCDGRLRRVAGFTSCSWHRRGSEAACEGRLPVSLLPAGPGHTIVSELAARLPGDGGTRRAS